MASVLQPLVIDAQDVPIAMKTPRVSWRTMVRAGAIMLALLVLLYEVGVNLALSKGLIAHLVSAKPESLHLEYASARSFWPGYVHVEGLELRSRSSSVEWALYIDAADADISLLSLLRHRFHVSKVAATGLTFRLRLRLEPDAVDEDRVARLPAIPGFDAVPLLGVPPDPPKGNGKPWTIDIQGVDAGDVREIWIDAFRLTGQVRVRGGFTLGEGRLVVAPASASVDAAALATGDDVMASAVVGELEAHVDPVNVDEVKGLAVLRYLTMRSALAGDAGGIRFLRHFLRRGAVVLAGGAGTFRGTTNVVHGIVTTGTTSHVELEQARVNVAGRTLEGRLRFDFATGDADDDHPASWTSLDAVLGDLSLSDPGAKGPTATCKSLRASAHAPQIDLGDPGAGAPELGYDWETRRCDVHDLRAVDATLPADSPFHIEGGSATVASRGEGTTRGLEADTRIDSKVTMNIVGARVTSGIKGDVPLEVSFVGRALDFGGTQLTLTDPQRPDWWAKVKATTVKVELAPPKVTLALTTSARDGAPFLAFYTGTRKSSVVADAALDILPSKLTQEMTANLHGGIHVTAAKQALDIRDLDVQGASSRLRGRLSKRGERLTGRILIEAGPAAVGIAFEGQKTSSVLVGAVPWYESAVPPGR